MAVVTLTTDFGLSDPFVGIMKGVMLKINPSITIVDITHDIEPQNIRQAVYVISSAFGYFPTGSVHLCVVDPGVGTERRPLAFEAGGHVFVGPDNGVFTEIINRLHPKKFYQASNPEMTLRPVSNTFHGRDVFAPVAAWLAGGTDPAAVGAIVSEPVMLKLPSQIRPAPNLIEGEIIHIDHFGNAITNITSGMMDLARKESNGGGLEIQTHGEVIEGLSPCYGAAPSDEKLAAVFGSWDTVELFVKNGSAASAYNLSLGDRVEARFC